VLSLAPGKKQAVSLNSGAEAHLVVSRLFLRTHFLCKYAFTPPLQICSCPEMRVKCSNDGEAHSYAKLQVFFPFCARLARPE